MTGSPRSEHHLVILRRGVGGESDVLVLKDGDGWSLPRIESEERRSADVAELNRAVGESLGLEVSVLRCLSDEPGDAGRPRRHLYVLETHGAVSGSGPRGEWVARGALDGRVPAGSPARRLLDAWRRHADGSDALAAGRDWVQPGWRDEILGWAAAQLARRGRSPYRAVEQIRLWEFSHVVRLETDEEPLYLKARPSDGVAEAPLTRRLAERHPAWTPEVIAIEPVRRWLLTRGAPGSNLMKMGDPGVWERAAAAIARMQIDWLAATDELAGLGCPRLTLRQLEREIPGLLDDSAALQPHRGAAGFGGDDPALGEDLVACGPHQADGLTDEEVEHLRRRGPELASLCRELAAEGVPESIEHGDLWGDNAIAGEDRVVFIDWEDASVAHPFFTPSLLLLSLHYTDALAAVPDARRRIRDAYLGPWAERGPLVRWPAARLERAFELAQQAAMLHYARQFWRLALPSIETSWEVRAFTPLFLRRLIGPGP